MGTLGIIIGIAIMANIVFCLIFHRWEIMLGWIVAFLEWTRRFYCA